MADRRQWQQVLADLEKLLRTRLAQADVDSTRALLHHLYRLAPVELTSKPDQAQAKQLTRLLALAAQRITELSAALDSTPDAGMSSLSVQLRLMAGWTLPHTCAGLAGTAQLRAKAVYPLVAAATRLILGPGERGVRLWLAKERPDKAADMLNSMQSSLWGCTRVLEDSEGGGAAAELAALAAAPATGPLRMLGFVEAAAGLTDTLAASEEVLTSGRALKFARLVHAVLMGTNPYSDALDRALAAADPRQQDALLQGVVSSAQAAMKQLEHAASSSSGSSAAASSSSGGSASSGSGDGGAGGAVGRAWRQVYDAVVCSAAQPLTHALFRMAGGPGLLQLLDTASAVLQQLPARPQPPLSVMEMSGLHMSIMKILAAIGETAQPILEVGASLGVDNPRALQAGEALARQLAAVVAGVRVLGHEELAATLPHLQIAACCHLAGGVFQAVESLPAASRAARRFDLVRAGDAGLRLLPQLAAWQATWSVRPPDNSLPQVAAAAAAAAAQQQPQAGRGRGRRSNSHDPHRMRQAGDQLAAKIACLVLTVVDTEGRGRQCTEAQAEELWGLHSTICRVLAWARSGRDAAAPALTALCGGTHGEEPLGSSLLPALPMALTSALDALGEVGAAAGDDATVLRCRRRVQALAAAHAAALPLAAAAAGVPVTHARFAAQAILLRTVLPAIALPPELRMEAPPEPADDSGARLQLAQAAAARSCAYLGCDHLSCQGGPAAGQREGSLKCSGCRAVYYCDARCQKADWKFHRMVCAELKAARQVERQATRQARQRSR